MRFLQVFSQLQAFLEYRQRGKCVSQLAPFVKHDGTKILLLSLDRASDKRLRLFMPPSGCVPNATQQHFVNATMSRLAEPSTQQGGKCVCMCVAVGGLGRRRGRGRDATETRDEDFLILVHWRCPHALWSDLHTLPIWQLEPFTTGKTGILRSSPSSTRRVMM